MSGQDLEIRMAKFEEKVENIKSSLDEIVKFKLPHIEKKLEDLTKYIYIGIGLGIAVQIVINNFL
jgi:flagellar biosynthesis/type III secretory pathway M-ring protein FliF/YscJ